MAQSRQFGSTRGAAPLLIGLAAVVLLVPGVSIFAVLISSSNEVSYDYGILWSSCRARAARCYTTIELKVGNTGTKLQDLVEIDLHGFPSWSNVSHSSIKIVASNDVQAIPHVAIDSESRMIRIEPLPANQMVEFGFLVAGPISREALESGPPKLVARGRVIRTSPKATALARAFRAVLGLLF